MGGPVRKASTAPTASPSPSATTTTTTTYTYTYTHSSSLSHPALTHRAVAPFPTCSHQTALRGG